jgi:riboflavin kinase/FMN adenylyltransferase
MAITFDRHPRQVVNTDWHPQLLTTLDEKVELLSHTGIDTLVIMRFDNRLAEFSARQFMADVLQRRLGVQMLLTGYDNRFGHDRTAAFHDYVVYGRELGMDVLCAQPLTAECGERREEGGERKDTAGMVFSSSLARRLLAAGDVTDAAVCLGRHYSLTGKVVHGERNGHALGFPTANLQTCDPLKIVPARGAYAVVATLEDGSTHPAMTNIGMRPTFSGQQQTLETHIFDYAGDLYGERLTIRFVARLRDEKQFSSTEELTAQLVRDKQSANEIISNDELNTLVSSAKSEKTSKT